MTLRTFRLAEPYQMHFDEVYHARTATEFLQDWRYGAVARHLRVDPPAPRQVRDGRRARAVGRGRRRAPRATSGSRSAPPSSSRAATTPAAPGGRAGERLHVATGTRDPDLRPAIAGAHLGRSRRPACQRARARPERPASWSSATTTGGSRRSTSTAIGRRRRSTGVGAARRSATVDHPVEHLLVADDGATIVVGVGRPPRRRRPRRPGDRRRRSTSPGIADLGRRRHRRGARRRPSPTSTDPAAAASSLAELLGGERGRLRGPARRGVAGDDGRPRRARAAATTRDGASTRPSPTARCPGIEVDARRRGSPSRPATASPSSTRRRVQVDHDDRRSTAARTAWRWSPASTTTAAVRDVGHGRRRRPTTSSRSRGDARQGRPGRRGRHPLPGPRHAASSTTRRARWSTSWAGSPGRGASGGRAVDRLRRRAARQRGLRRRPARRTGFTPVGLGRRHQRRATRRRTARSCSSSTAPGRRPRSTLGSHAFAWRLPGRHRRRPDRSACSTCSRGSCSGAGSSPAWSGCSSSSTGCSSSSRGSA